MSVVVPPSSASPGGGTGRTWARGQSRLVLVLVAITPLGLALKFHYHGPCATWARDYAAGVLYEVFWIVLLCLAASRASSAAASVSVLVGTCLLEVLQLWHPHWLEACRRTVLGATILGTSFDWLDFPHYAIGAGLGYVLVRWARGWRC